MVEQAKGEGMDSKNRWVPIILSIGVAVILGVALLFRCIDLDHIPGINGDETWYGITVLAWRDGQAPPLKTYSGLPLNPFYSGLLYLLHLVCHEPSFVVIRLAPLLSVLLAVGLSYPLVSRALDRRTALIVTLLLACLPITIGYSRLGWDQSQAFVVSLVMICLVLLERSRWAFVAFLLALVVHPVNVFLAPFLAGTDVARGLLWPLDASAEERRAWGRWLWPRLAFVIGLAVAGLVVGLAALARAEEWLQALVAEFPLRLLRAEGWLEYLELYGELLSGASMYHAVSGDMGDGAVLRDRLLFWGILIALLIVGVPRLIRQRDARGLGLIISLCVCVAGFYLAVSTGPARPAYTRYFVWLVTPSCLVLAVLLRSLGDGDRHWHAQLGGVLVVCFLLLWSFHVYYFMRIRTTGGDSEQIYVTGPVEPKKAAFEHIVAEAGEVPRVAVIGENYFCTLPVRYLAHGRPGMRVLDGDDSREVANLGDAERWFLVCWAEHVYHPWLEEHAPAAPRKTIYDYGQRPVLHVWDLGTDKDKVRALLSAVPPTPR